MTEQELIRQLKTLRDIHPDQKWANITRSRIIIKRGIFDFFDFAIPKPLAISVMAVVVAVFGGLNVYNAWLVDSEVGNSQALTASLKHVADETAVEIAEIQDLARLETSVKANKEKSKGGQGETSSTPNLSLNTSGSHTVVFNQEAEERDNFQALLRERIEVKIAYVRDLFAQVEDGDSIREIMQNPRRYEDNFKIFGEGLDEQVKGLLGDAEKALAEGDLITALDLVNAIEKLIKN